MEQIDLKVRELELQISALVTENEKMMLERNGFSEKANDADRLNSELVAALTKIRDYHDCNAQDIARNVLDVVEKQEPLKRVVPVEKKHVLGYCWCLDHHDNLDLQS